ncbi:MAG: ATPase domain-containing protein [Thermoplasmatota archaeon]
MRGRSPTHIPGLDELMNGGFPKGTINLIAGPPGSAKSLMGMHYIHNGAMFEDEPGIYLSLEESRDSILRAAASYGMNLESHEKEGKLYLIDLGKMRIECTSAEELEWGLASFETLQDLLKNHLSFSGSKRLVLDSVTAVGLYYKTPDLLRRELFKFSRFLKDSGITAIIISEIPEEGDSSYGMEEFISDSLIKLDYESTTGEYRRTLTIKKMRFTKHDPLKHPFLIMENGIEVSPDEVIG